MLPFALNIMSLAGNRMKYSCRPRLFQPVFEFELGEDGLARRGPFGMKKMRFNEITKIEVFKERRLGSSRSYWACTVHADRQVFRLSAGHRLPIARTEDRTSSYIPFIQEFERRAVSAKPAINFIVDEYREALGPRLYGPAALCTLECLGRLPRKVSASICAAILRNVGFMLGGNRYARQQVSAAFPTLGSREARAIVRGMWDNLGRMFGEYGHFSELMQFSPETPLAGQVIMDEGTAEAMRGIARERCGAIMVAAHFSNWEVPAMAARAAGFEIAVMYKRQPSTAIAAELQRRRTKFAARQIEVGSAAPHEILRALRDGMLVGLLVDQYYARGIEVSFFGRVCRVNPLPALLAGTGNWPIYGAHVVRLPDQRYRFEIVGPLRLPREPTGRIDVKATTQAIFDMIESWIREAPNQWIWLHRLIR
jgi:Kdo2-lipid IVA lauroyltransferase/acyltransferase